MNKKFYEFNQNNSGGSFDVNNKLCHRLMIEADNEKEAVKKAKNMGVYFNGCAKGMDCSCCGDCWNEPEEINFPFTEYPNKVFKNIIEFSQYLANNYGWTKPDIRIFYKNGKVKEIFI